MKTYLLQSQLGLGNGPVLAGECPIGYPVTETTGTLSERTGAHPPETTILCVMNYLMETALVPCVALALFSKRTIIAMTCSQGVKALLWSLSKDI